MASYTVKRAKTATLVASTVDTVTFNERRYEFAITNHDATAVVYVRFDATPTVEGDDASVVRPGDTIIRSFYHSPKLDVRLISAGTPKYTVEATR